MFCNHTLVNNMFVEEQPVNLSMAYCLNAITVTQLRALIPNIWTVTSIVL